MAAKTILGISPGTRALGLAVLGKDELIEWKVRSFKEAWSAQKKTRILSTIASLIDYYEIHIISLKKINPLKSSKELDSLVAAVEKLAQQKSIKVKSYSLEQLDYDRRSGRRDGKAKLTERIAEKHPELRREYLIERNNRAEYYTKMFEAIAIAERCRE